MATETEDLDISLDTSGVTASTLFKAEEDHYAIPDMPASMKQRIAEKEQAAIEAAAKAKGDKQDLAAADTEENIVLNPLTGAIVYLDDIDSVIAGCASAKDQINDLRSHERLLRETALKFTSGDAKTRRIQGHKLRAKVEISDISWDQGILKEAWNSFPKHRDDYLKIGTIDVKLREYKKLKDLATDDPSFQQFKGMLDSANRGQTGLPTVTVEE